MPESRLRKAFYPYLVAVALIAVALGMRLWLVQALGMRSVWVMFYPAVMLAALYGGLYAGILGAALSVVSVVYLFPIFAGQPMIKDFEDWLSAAVFFLTCVMTSAVVEAMRRAQASVRRSTEELARSEEHFRLLVEGVKDYAIFMLDPQGIVLSWNAGAERIKGYKTDEIVGRHFLLFYTPEDVESGRPDLALKVAAEEGRYFTEGWRVRKDGSRFQAECLVSALHDKNGMNIGFTKITRDVTERKLAEAERERLMADHRQAASDAIKSRAQFEAVFQSMQDGLVVFDRDGNVTLVNEAEARINGFGSAEEMKRNMAFFAGVYELAGQDGARLAVEDWPVSRIMRGETLSNVELRGRRTDTGQEWYFSFSGAPIYDERGKIELVVTVTRDITARKKAEDDVRRLNSELEQRVVERTEQLEAANIELEAFSYSVSHDLRAPLRAIDGFSQVLLEDYTERLDEAGRDSLRRIRAASQRMALLIDDMLNLSRVTRAEMRTETVDLSLMSAAIAEELKKTSPERDVTFIIAPGVAAQGDGRLLRVVMENLLGNAWKFTGKHPRARIEFGVAEKDGTSAYFVRDDGAGFDMNYGHKLFGVFQRLHAMTEFIGTGIGLATVQRIIRRHGGRVWAEGAVERGATFYFTL